ncbi:MAG: hypothetical protein AB1627_01045 [Chloroflexota bacterium]
MPSSLVHPRLAERLIAHGFYPSAATVEADTPTRTASGAEVHAWSPVTGLADIPAAVAPMIFTRRGESRSSELTAAETTHRIGLAGAWPAITAAMRLVVSGQHAGIYDIVRPDTDSQTGFTVLEARIASPVAEAGL